MRKKGSSVKVGNSVCMTHVLTILETSIELERMSFSRPFVLGLIPWGCLSCMWLYKSVHKKEAVEKLVRKALDIRKGKQSKNDCQTTSQVTSYAVAFWFALKDRLALTVQGHLTHESKITAPYSLFTMFCLCLYICPYTHLMGAFLPFLSRMVR